jgi:hypothetical protein
MWLYSFGSFPVWLPFVGKCHISINLVLLVSVILAGLVGSMRLWLGAHRPIELYAGFALGLLSQFMALKFLI